VKIQWKKWSQANNEKTKQTSQNNLKKKLKSIIQVGITSSSQACKKFSFIQTTRKFTQPF
jgi:hypothetical protein